MLLKVYNQKIMLCIHDKCDLGDQLSHVLLVHTAHVETQKSTEESCGIKYFALKVVWFVGKTDFIEPCGVIKEHYAADLINCMNSSKTFSLRSIFHQITCSSIFE